jgi:DNA-binding GntR family transcriptional regulator
MKQPVPFRHSLIDETASVLRRRIAAGEWSRLIPGKIELAGLLQVGRNTLRSALGILESEGLLSKVPGGRRVIVSSTGGRLAVKCAAYLMAKPKGDTRDSPLP